MRLGPKFHICRVSRAAIILHAFKFHLVILFRVMTHILLCTYYVSEEIKTRREIHVNATAASEAEYL